MNPQLQDLRDAVARNPGDQRAWYALGTAALEARNLGEACLAFAKAVSLAPQEAEPAVSAAEQLARAGCHADAENILRKVLERAPGRPDARLRLASVLLETDREPLALAELTALARERPRDVEVRLLMAAAHEWRGALAKAAEQLTAAAGVDSQNVEVNRRLAIVLGRMGDHAGAVRCWRLVVMRTRGKDREALTALGIALSSVGQHGEALQILREVARRNAQSASALADLGMALIAAERLDEAAAVFGRALDLDPGSAQAHCGLGMAYERQGRLQEAVQAFRATEELAPENAAGPLNLGLTLQKLGDHEGAHRALLRAARLDPDDPETQAALAAGEPPAVPTTMAAPAPIPRGYGPSISGDLASFQLFDVLEFLRLHRKSGSLVVWSPNGTGVVRLLGGAVTSASTPKVKRLGETLLDGRLITRPQLELALAQQREQPRAALQSLGSVLLGKKVIDQDRLSVAIRRQLVAALEDMLVWREGTFSFHAAEVGDGPPVSFDLQDVMLKLMRMTDERKAGKPPRPD
jgi:tetratricopeptide (TPR) repeat protein